jgi:hypothetical protein
MNVESVATSMTRLRETRQETSRLTLRLKIYPMSGPVPFVELGKTNLFLCHKSLGLKYPPETGEGMVNQVRRC